MACATRSIRGGCCDADRGRESGTVSAVAIAGERAAPVAAPEQRLLEVEDLRVYFDTEDGVLHAVDGVSLHVDAGETLGVVGESGCGKSVTAMTVMRLLPMPPGRIAGGAVRWRGTDLVKADDAKIRS